MSSTHQIARRPRLPVAAVLFLVLFAAQAGLLVLTPLLGDVARTFGVSVSEAGQLRTVCGLAAGATALGLGRLAGRLALRPLLAGCLALLAAASAASAAAPSLLALGAAQVAIGFAVAVLVGGGLAAAGEWSEPGERARVLSWALLGQPAAWLVGMPVIGAVGEASWRWAWVAMPLAASLLALIAVAAAPARGGRVPEGVRAGEALRVPGVSRWAAGELLAYSAWGGTLVYAGALFVETYETSSALTGIVLGAAAMANVAGNLAGRRLVEGHTGARLAMLAGAASPLVAAFGTLRTGVLASLLLVSAVAAVCGARTLAGSAYGLHAEPGQRVAIQGLRAAASQFGYLVGAAVGGAAIALGGYAALGWALAALFAAAAVPHLPALRAARAARRPPVLILGGRSAPWRPRPAPH